MVETLGQRNGSFTTKSTLHDYSGQPTYVISDPGRFSTFVEYRPWDYQPWDSLMFIELEAVDFFVILSCLASMIICALPHTNILILNQQRPITPVETYPILKWIPAGEN